MAKSAPHVYLSTLPFAPTCSLVSMHYSSMFPQMLHVKSGQLSHWPPLEMVISDVGGGSIPLQSHQMASTLSQVQRIKQFVCGMP
jgi:hypothetical protein